MQLLSKANLWRTDVWKAQGSLRASARRAQGVLYLAPSLSGIRRILRKVSAMHPLNGSRSKELQGCSSDHNHRFNSWPSGSGYLSVVTDVRSLNHSDARWNSTAKQRQVPVLSLTQSARITCDAYFRILQHRVSVSCRIVLTVACLTCLFATLVSGQTADPVSEAQSLMNKGAAR